MYQYKFTAIKIQELAIDVDRTISELIALLSSFSEQKLNTTPFDGSWTAAQVGDHLLKSYGLDVLLGAVIPTDRHADQKVPMIRSIFLNFDIKMNSPEFIIPSPRPIAKEVLIYSLENKKTELTDIIKTKDLSATCVGFVIPDFGEFTRMEWIYLMLFHTQRHIHQLKKNSELLNKE